MKTLKELVCARDIEGIRANIDLMAKIEGCAVDYFYSTDPICIVMSWMRPDNLRVPSDDGSLFSVSSGGKITSCEFEFGPVEEEILEMVIARHPCDMKLSAALDQAATIGSVPLCKWLIARGSSPKSYFLVGYKKHPVHSAILAGNPETAMFLGPLTEYCCELTAAASMDAHHVVRYFLERREYTKEKKSSALYDAVRHGAEQTMSVLLEYDADPRYCGSWLFVLQCAYYQGTCVQKLLEMVPVRANDTLVSHQDGKRHTLLEWALLRDNVRDEVVDIEMALAANPHFSLAGCEILPVRQKKRRAIIYLYHNAMRSWAPSDCSKLWRVPIRLSSDDLYVTLGILKSDVGMFLRLAVSYAYRGMQYDPTVDNQVVRRLNMRWTTKTNALGFPPVFQKHQHTIALLCTFLTLRSREYPWFYLPCEMWYLILMYTERSDFLFDTTWLSKVVLDKITDYFFNV
jgi:hypothetical protein